VPHGWCLNRTRVGHWVARPRFRGDKLSGQ